MLDAFIESAAVWAIVLTVVFVIPWIYLNVMCFLFLFFGKK